MPPWQMGGRGGGGCVKGAGAALQDVGRQPTHRARCETQPQQHVCGQAGSLWTALLAPGLMPVMCGV